MRGEQIRNSNLEIRNKSEIRIQQVPENVWPQPSGDLNLLLAALFRISDFGFRIFAIVVLAVAFATSLHAQEVVTYRAFGHLDPGDGTIEFWLRLEVDAVKPDGTEVMPYYWLFNLTRPGDPGQHAGFSYSRGGAPNHYALICAGYGSVDGKPVENPAISSLEDTVEVAKADRTGTRYPRIPRLKAGEWHHLALTWSGGALPLFNLYVDGKPAAWPVRMKAPPFGDLRELRFNLQANSYQDSHSIDDLRISSIARSAEEIQQSAQAGRSVADRYTILLDRFEQFRHEGDRHWTTPEVHATGLESETGLILRRDCVELVEGKSGKALRFLKWYK
jgi:hypothetical protein